jgi:SAM-dependent methyltransferase
MSEQSGGGAAKMSERDTYEMLAKHYDGAYEAMRDLVDAPFYVEMARESGGPVLEIGCGTGRVLLRIAGAGVAIEGVDNSQAMLSVLQSHLEKEPAAIRERVKIHSGDMRKFRLNKQFPLVIIPFRPLQHMHTLRDQVDALATAAAHVSENGRLVFDVFFPKFELMTAGIGEERLEIEWNTDGPKRTLRRYFRKDSFDKIRQNFTGTFFVRTYEGEKFVKEDRGPLKLSWYTRSHLEALFLLTGLEVVEEYGSFAKAPLDNDATEMIFVLKKGPEWRQATLGG